MNWYEGRQKTGYFVKRLINLPFKYFGGVDAYIIKMPVGAYMSEHTDVVDSFCGHYRLNIILKKAKVGGLFKCEKTFINTDRIKFFRPDKYEHSVTKVEEGTRYVFSIGWATLGKSVKYN